MYKTTNAPRRYLLTTVSVMALLGSVDVAMADDDSKPVLWIEASGQLEQLSDKQEAYSPPFMAQLLTNPLPSPIKLQAPPRLEIGEEARISFTPEDSPWTFSAAIRYGRAGRNGISHHETVRKSVEILESVPSFNFYADPHYPPAAARYETTVAKTSNVDTILDFQAGKDVGIGIFGSRSLLSGGVRFAQFSSRSVANINADPDFTVSYKYLTNFFGIPANIKFPSEKWDMYAGRMSASRRFSGLGPSLQWEGSATLAGHQDAGALDFDWGVNGAILFGHQKVRAHHQTSRHHASGLVATNEATHLVYLNPPHDTVRSRSVIVPNAGGFAGLSLRYPNAKISIGYKVDFFFNAIDGGIDARKNENRGFFGPYASISIGLGD